VAATNGRYVTAASHAPHSGYYYAASSSGQPVPVPTSQYYPSDSWSAYGGYASYGQASYGNQHYPYSSGSRGTSASVRP
jgi:hypothetical protein